MKTERVTRLNSLIKEKLGQLIAKETTLGHHALISITKVDTAADLSQAKIFVSIFTPNEEDHQPVYNKLIKLAKPLRFGLAQTIEIRNTPRLIFVQDDSIGTEEKLLKLIAKANTGK